MKKLILPLAVTAFALAACAPEAEDKVENAYENKADKLDEKAEDIREAADEKADVLEEKADRMDAMAETMGDKVEAGTLDKSEAMPGNVMGNDENKIQESVE